MPWGLHTSSEGGGGGWTVPAIAQANPKPTKRQLSQMSAALQQFWNKVDGTFAHIQYNKWLSSPENLTKAWEKQWLHRFPSLEGAAVVEYGIGGGLLAHHLFHTRNISQYTGIDISQRQINESRRRLRGLNVRLIRADALDARLIKGKVDLFVSQAVIQHFESMVYFTNFLKQVEVIKPARIMLQTRHATTVQERGKRGLTRLTGWTGPAVGQVQFSLSVPTSSFLKFLPSYRLEWQSAVNPGNRYVFHDLKYVTQHTPSR